jgi:hypothetical protein
MPPRHVDYEAVGAKNTKHQRGIEMTQVAEANGLITDYGGAKKSKKSSEVLGWWHWRFELDCKLAVVEPSKSIPHGRILTCTTLMC